jgi:YbbR domain-containing protein
VVVKPVNTRGGLRVEAVLPETIEVRLAQLIQKAVPVVIDVEGEPVSGFTMAEPEPGEDTVFVSGPQEYVDQVVQATASINVTGRTGPIDQAVRLSPRNSQGVLVQGVDLDPALTDVHIEISQETFSRSMAVDPVPTGSPADGYNVVSISVNPPVVTIRGEEAFIVGTASIPTKPIDISGASREVVKTVSLDLPSGAEVTGGNSVVTVTIKIEPAIGDFQFTVPVTASNLNAALSITGALPSATVTLRGPLPTLRNLSLSQISASVDLNGLEAGTHHLTVNVTAPTGITVRTVSPAEIDVIVEQR